MRIAPLVLAFAAFAPALVRAQPAPSGAHPRIWLDTATLTTLRAQAADSSTGAARAVARCAEARKTPSSYADPGYQGFGWAATLSTCALAYQITQSSDDAQTALVYFNKLLDDDPAAGAGQGGDAVVRHDSGYAMRTFGVYAPLAYDWLHDAPGMTDALRAHARERFAAWNDWYAKSGYLPHVAGSNYACGYVLAATLTAIAEGGEAGPAGDQLWTTVVGTLFGGDVAGGLQPGAALDGGDWAEGWEYGPLSVLELAMAARALEEQGVKLPALDAWSDSLALRYFYGSTPTHGGVYIGGDTQETSHYAAPFSRALLATVAGPASAEARSWARSELATQRLGDDEFLVYQALADARAGAAAPFPPAAPTTYVAGGTRTVYARASWTPDAAWGVFQSAPRQVPDHQHPDAGNWVLSRGADDLIVDPSPYGTRSTLTGNAPAIDSGNLPQEYRPSQGDWGLATGLAWTRVATGGVVIARGDYADQYRLEDTPSDVARATRDWIFVPSGADATVVQLDRVSTGDAARGLHLRLRAPAALALDGDVAHATIGAAQVSARRVWSSSGALQVDAPPVADNCDVTNFGACANARFAVGEAQLDVSGPDAGALIVVDGFAAGAPGPGADAIAAAGVHGVTFVRGGRRVVVVSPDGSAAQVSYAAPADGPALHVVVDAPVDTSGRSDVSAAAMNGQCAIAIAAHAGSGAGFIGRPLAVDVGADCSVKESQAGATGNGMIGMGGVDPNNPGGPAQPGATVVGGCQLGAAPVRATLYALALAIAIVLAALAVARARRS